MWHSFDTEKRENLRDLINSWNVLIGMANTYYEKNHEKFQILHYYI